MYQTIAEKITTNWEGKRLTPLLVVYYFRLLKGVLTGGAMNLYCKTDRRENPFAAHRYPLKEDNSSAAKDWNDSGGQRPAQINWLMC